MKKFSGTTKADDFTVLMQSKSINTYLAQQQATEIEPKQLAYRLNLGTVNIELSSSSFVNLRMTDSILKGVDISRAPLRNRFVAISARKALNTSDFRFNCDKKQEAGQ